MIAIRGDGSGTGRGERDFFVGHAARDRAWAERVELTDPVRGVVERTLDSLAVRTRPGCSLPH